MLWNWWVLALSILVFAGAGAAYGLLRTPEYTATSRLAVGRIDITSPGALSGFALATEALATGYSRTVTAVAVARPVAQRTGLTVKDVQSQVTATPVPESPIFKIEASATDPGQAVALANLSGRGLIRYATRLNRSNPDSDRLYAQYRAARANHEPLRAGALAKAYTASVQSQASTQLIQVISPATEASSDRRSTFIIFTFIGLVVGLLLGGAVAYAREARLHPPVP